MSLRNITRQSVLEAIEEFDQVGRNYFLKKYHFGHAKSYWLVYDGRKYDSKAIIGVAHKYARPDLGQLKNFKQQPFNLNWNRWVSRFGWIATNWMISLCLAKLILILSIR